MPDAHCLISVARLSGSAPAGWCAASQRQRLALARGLIAAEGSSVLLLDEPTSALDAVIERPVFERLAARWPECCVVVSVHRLTLLPLFDRVIWMGQGRVLATGTATELQARHPAFAALCQPASKVPAARARHSGGEERMHG